MFTNPGGNHPFLGLALGFLLLLSGVWGRALKVSQGGLQRDGVEVHSVGRAFETSNCVAKKIEHSWSVPISCFANVLGFSFPNFEASSTVGVEMELYLPPDFALREYLFSYASSLPHGREMPRIQNTSGLARAMWTTMVIWLPNFKSAKGKSPDFGFGFVDWKANYLEFCKNQQSSVHYRNLLESGRNSTLEAGRMHFNREEGVYLRSLKMIHPKMLSVSQAEGILTKLYPSYFDQDWGQHLLSLILICLGLSLALFWRNRISVKLLLGFLIPSSGLLVFLGLNGSEYLNTLRNSRITTLQQEMEEDYHKIQDLAERNGQEFLARVPGWVSEIQALVNQKQVDEKGIPTDMKVFEALLDQIHQASSKTKQKEVEKAVAKRYLSALHQLYANGSSERDDYEAEARLLFNSEASQDWNQSWNRGRVIRLARLSDPLVLFRKRLVDRLGASLNITNGAVFYSHRSGRGLGRVNYLVKAAAQQLLDEIRDDGKGDASNRKKRMELISAFSEKIDFPLRSLDEYLNRPLRPMVLGSGHRGGFEHRKFWTSFSDTRGQDWIVMVELEGHSIFLGLPQKIREYLRDSSGNNSLENGNSFLFMGQRQGQGHGHDSIYYADFPYQAQNTSALSLATSLAKSRAGKTFLATSEDGKIDLLLCGIFPDLPSYSLALVRGLDSEFLALSHRLNFYYLILILGSAALVFLSFLISSWITRPLKMLQEGLGRVERGELSQKLWVPGRNEFRDLAWRFNAVLVALRDKEEITRFLSKSTARSIVSSSQDVVREEVTILFAGLLETEKGGLSQGDESLAALQDLISRIQSLVFDNGGMVDKFTGSACLGVFRGESIHNNPLYTCVELVTQLRAMNTIYRLERKKIQKIGVGLATGPVVLGHVGSRDRKDYTCIGNTVNMAARLETLGRDFKQDISVFLDQKTYDFHKDDPQWNFQELEPVRIKGKRDLQKVYELLEKAGVDDVSS
jgi:class 3 adenylate cyclase